MNWSFWSLKNFKIFKIYIIIKFSESNDEPVD